MVFTKMMIANVNCSHRQSETFGTPGDPWRSFGRKYQFPFFWDTLWWTYKKQWKMAIEIVDFPIKNGDFPLLCESSPEGIPRCSDPAGQGFTELGPYGGCLSVPWTPSASLPSMTAWKFSLTFPSPVIGLIKRSSCRPQCPTLYLQKAIGRARSPHFGLHMRICAKGPVEVCTSPIPSEVSNQIATAGNFWMPGVMSITCYIIYSLFILPSGNLT